MMENVSKDLLNQKCSYQGTKWKIVGITNNALGTFVTLRQTAKGNQTSANLIDVVLDKEK